MIYKIKLMDPYDNELIKRLQQDNQDQHGLRELYDNLLVLGYTESYSQNRIYYIANGLQENNVQFTVTQYEG